MSGRSLTANGVGLGVWNLGSEAESCLFDFLRAGCAMGGWFSAIGGWR